MSIPAKVHLHSHLATLIIPFLISYGTTSLAAESGHDMHQHHATAATQPDVDPHAAHRQAAGQIGYSRTLARYTIPSTELITLHGEHVSLAKILDSDQPVVVNFIFTSCTTICPIMSATFAHAQKKLGEEAAQVRWVSISIDPEYDTPERLRDYAEHFHAGTHWSFLTGSTEDITAVQRAFDVYRGDKMNHIPVTLLRAGRNAPWVRLHGLSSGAELVSEYRQLMTQH